MVDQAPGTVPQDAPVEVTRPLATLRQPSDWEVSLKAEETARLVEVALVLVPFVTVREEIVEDAARMMPLVEVGARYPFPWIDQSLKVDDPSMLRESEPPRETEPPIKPPAVLMVTDELARSVFATVAQEATPRASRERTN